jgi:hypothetical protein
MRNVWVEFYKCLLSSYTRRRVAPGFFPKRGGGAAARNVTDIFTFNPFKNMKNALFWNVALCISCVYRRFGGTYRLRLQGWEIRVRGTSVNRWLQAKPPVENTQHKHTQPPAHVGSSLADFLPWRWRRYVPPKRWLTQYLHSATYKKTAFFIVTAVETSTLTFKNSFPDRPYNIQDGSIIFYRQF